MAAYPGSYAAEKLTSGEALFSRAITVNEIGLVSGRLHLTYWTAVTTGTADHVLTATGATAAATVTYAAVGLYAVNADGSLSLAGQTADLHASLWGLTFANYNSVLAAAFPRSAGSRYAMGLLCVGTTMPTIVGADPYGAFTNVAPTMSSYLDGLSVLPQSVTAAQVASGGDHLLYEAVVSP